MTDPNNLPDRVQPRPLRPVRPGELDPWTDRGGYEVEPANGSYLDPAADPAYAAYGWPVEVIRPGAAVHLPRELPDTHQLAAGRLSYGWSHRPLRADASPGYRRAVGNIALTVRVLVLGLASIAGGGVLLVVVVMVSRVLGWLL